MRAFPIALCLRFGALLAAPFVVAPQVPAQAPADAAATGVIIGRIFNPATGEYVRNAQIRVEATGQAAVSESGGRYHLSGVPAGQQTLVVSFTGYRPETAVVRVEAGATASQDFRLASTAQAEADEVIKLEDFVVVAQREGQAKAIMDQRRSMNITNTVASDVFGDDGEGNVAEFLKHLPGVMMEGSFGEPRNIGLRGLSSAYTTVTIDGMPMASSDPTSQGANNSRTFTFENASLSAMDSIEVSKTISADQDASAPAGTINLRTKRAFDRPGQRITWQANLAGHSTALTLKQTLGPGEGRHHKIRPGGMLEYSNSFFDNRFGVVLSVSESNIYQEANIVTLTFDRNPTTADPRPVVISQMLFNQAVRFNERFATTLNMDYKVGDNLILTLNTLYNWSELWNPQRNVLFTSGARNTVVGAAPLTSFSTTASNAIAAARQSNISKMARTFTTMPRFEYTRGNLVVEGRGLLSRAFTWYDPLGHRSSLYSLNAPSTTGQRYTASRASDNAYDWTITQTSGNDWADGFTNNPSAIVDDGRHSARNLYSGELFAKLRTEIGSIPVEFKAGVKAQDEHYTYGTRLNYAIYNYTPDGTNTGYNGFPSTFAWNQAMMNNTFSSLSGRGPFMPDLEAIGTRFLTSPQEFTHAGTVAQWTTVNITSPRLYDEMVNAAYLMGTGTRGKATFRAGLRWEQTNGDATMLGKRPDAEVLAAGYSLAANGDATTIPGLQFQYLDAPRVHRKKTYDDLFPSASFKYNLARNLDLQVGYSRTIRRPAFKDVAGVFQVNEQTRIVTAPNINLEPEYSDNLSVRLAYYFEPVGIIAINGFMNNVNDLMIQNSVPIEEYGYTGDEDLTGYTVNTTTNSPGTTKIKGFEFEYSQSLSFLPGILRGLGVRASYSHNDAERIVPGMVPNQVSGGFNFSWRQFSTSWNAIWSDDVPTVENGTQWRRHRAELAASASYRLTSRLTLFVSGRNITNSRDVQLDKFPNLPTVWRVHSLYGATYTCGIKGTF